MVLPNLSSLPLAPAEPAEPIDGLFDSPPMFQGQRVYSMEYAEIESIRSFREGWMVTVLLNLGDARLRGRATVVNIVFEVYRITDYDPNDGLLLPHVGAKFVARVMRSTRDFGPKDFTKAAWRQLQQAIAPIAIGPGLGPSDGKEFYMALLVAMGLPIKRLQPAGYDSWRERDSRRNELPEDWF